MKKRIALLMLCAILSLSACGQRAAPEPTAAPAAVAEDGVDVDLTRLSSTMVYSEVYAMVYEPEQYLGKTVKMKGLFSTGEDADGLRRYACVVPDATACCAQGLEFEPGDGYGWPEDFPEPGGEITVVGTFDSYRQEQGGNYYVYLVLRDAKVV